MLDNPEGIEEWQVDLDDWEKILRIKSSGITAGVGIIESMTLMDQINFLSKSSRYFFRQSPPP
jgi:tRNA(Ser,Leu) C12 N-acetylase TAN1